MSPFASASAFLQSIIPAPVCSRSSFTCPAEISANSPLPFPVDSPITRAWLAA